MANNRQPFHVPPPEEISPDPYEQTLWYDELPLPSEPTVEQEVLRPMGLQSSFRKKNPAAGKKNPPKTAQSASYHWARGIVAMEVLGMPRSRRPWQPR